MSDPTTNTTNAREAQLLKLRDALADVFKTPHGRELSRKMPKALRAARPKTDPLDSRVGIRLSPVYYRALDALDVFYSLHTGRSPSRGLLIRRAIEALVTQTREIAKSGDKVKLDAECAAMIRHVGAA